MNVIERPIWHFIDEMDAGRPFALAGYSDAEWYCMMGLREGETTGLGQILSKDHGRRLIDVLKRRHCDPRFWFAVPRALWQQSGFNDMGTVGTDRFLGRHHVYLDVFERDMLTDNLAQTAALYPLIRQLRKMNVVMIGNQALEVAAPHLISLAFIGVSSPNLHLERGGIENAVERAADWVKRFGRPVVFLVSAGVSAAVIIDQLYDRAPGNWYIDCGSIWDAFAGIGGQREWRKRLYDNPAEWERWKKANLTGE